MAYDAYYLSPAWVDRFYSGHEYHFNLINTGIPYYRAMRTMIETPTIQYQADKIWSRSRTSIATLSQLFRKHLKANQIVQCMLNNPPSL